MFASNFTQSPPNSQTYIPLKSHTQRYGLQAEQWVLEELHRRGHHSAVLVSNYFANVDILIDSLPVEVKIARPTWQSNGKCRRRRWQFNIHAALNPLRTEFVLIAIAEDEHGQYHPYIIPSAWLVGNGRGRRHIQITSHPTRYAGMYAPALNSWNVIPFLLEQKYRQAGQLHLPLFETINHHITEAQK